MNTKNPDKKTLSVIVPVYNVEPYLKRCLDSILAQTRLPDEIICVDDGSTDGCGEILDQYAKENDRIKVIHKANGGLVSARKAGLEKATGDYATYVDSDDWIESEMYSVMMEVAENSGVDVITSDCIHDYGDHQTIEKEKVEMGFYYGAKLEEVLEKLIDTEKFFSRTITVHIYNKLFRRELLRKHQIRVPDQVSVAEDVACTYPCLLDSYGVYVTGKAFYHYCFRNDSMVGGRSSERDIKKLEDTFLFVKKELDEFSGKISNIDRQIRCQEVYSWLLFKPERIMSYQDDILYPYGKIGKEDRVVIYGAGSFGYQLKAYIEQHTDLHIVAWADRSNKSEGIISPEKLTEIDSDVILIAVLLADVVDDIVSYLMDLGIPEKRIRKVTVE